MFKNLDQSDDVKEKLAEILKITNRMCLNKEQKEKFAKYLIDRYITTDENECYTKNPDKAFEWDYDEEKKE